MWLLILTAVLSPDDVRVWTDPSGQFSIKAALVQVVDQKASLRNCEGKLVEVPVSRLSQHDSDYLSGVHKARKAAVEKTVVVRRKYLAEHTKAKNEPGRAYEQRFIKLLLAERAALSKGDIPPRTDPPPLPKPKPNLLLELARSPDLSPDQRDILIEGEKQRKLEIVLLKRQIEHYQKPPNPHVRNQQQLRANRERKIRSYRDEIKKLETGGGIFFPRIELDKVALGQIGILKYPENVISTDKSKVNIDVLQIIDADNMLVNVFGKTFWMRGVSTKGLVSESKFAVPFPCVFRVRDTETYATALGGSNTVFLLEKVDIEGLERRAREL